MIGKCLFYITPLTKPEIFMETENKRWTESAIESSYVFCQSHHCGWASYCHTLSILKYFLLRKWAGGAKRVHAAFFLIFNCLYLTADFHHTQIKTQQAPHQPLYLGFQD